MYLKYYLDDRGKRVYTFQEFDPSGNPTKSAHPARFSPEDQFSQYRIITKKRFGLLLADQATANQPNILESEKSFGHSKKIKSEPK
ncbi:unnamed protein product [Anisakis simplex]|uniref:Nucleolar protein 10 n=1 Tax=Anisakis simplex TaxID=6269 RepID=A0A0M3KA36_ANISI|nr:unnamed protein product [Anisakis simplex]